MRNYPPPSPLSLFKKINKNNGLILSTHVSKVHRYGINNLIFICQILTLKLNYCSFRATIVFCFFLTHRYWLLEKCCPSFNIYDGPCLNTFSYTWVRTNLVSRLVQKLVLRSCVPLRLHLPSICTCFVTKSNSSTTTATHNQPVLITRTLFFLSATFIHLINSFICDRNNELNLMFIFASERGQIQPTRTLFGRIIKIKVKS